MHSDTRYIGNEIGVLNHLLRRRMCGVFCGMPSPAQGRVLFYLDHATTDVYQKDIETHLSIRRSTATGLLQTMEESGLITRQSVSHDARLKKIELTEKAVRCCAEIQLQLQTLEHELEHGLSAEEIAFFFRVSDKIKANLEEKK